MSVSHYQAAATANREDDSTIQRLKDDEAYRCQAATTTEPVVGRPTPH